MKYITGNGGESSYIQYLRSTTMLLHYAALFAYAEGLCSFKFKIQCLRSTQ